MRSDTGVLSSLGQRGDPNSWTIILLYTIHIMECDDRPGGTTSRRRGVASKTKETGTYEGNRHVPNRDGTGRRAQAEHWCGSVQKRVSDQAPLRRKNNRTTHPRGCARQRRALCAIRKPRSGTKLKASHGTTQKISKGGLDMAWSASCNAEGSSRAAPK